LHGEGERDGARAWGYMTIALAAASASVVLLIALMWRYVPAQAAVLACSQQPLPFLTNVVLFVASWFFRVLPFVIIFGGPVALILMVIIIGASIKARGSSGFARRMTRLATLAACGVLVACGVIVYATRTGARPTSPECGVSSGQ
jgi:type II secretory pathway component PulF